MESAGHATSKSAKESRDEKLKDSKMEEQIVKSLGNSNSVEDKLNALVKKFAEMDKENKKLTTNIKLHEKRYECLLREKDNLQKDYNKGVLMRDKLQQICREQQKLIKSVKNESLAKIREEEERRKENQVKFQKSINEINETLSKNNEENLRLKEDNIEMTKKVKYLAEQYQAREKQQEKINEQISLENQLHEAKLAKAKMDAAIEKKLLLQEKKNLVDELDSSRQTIKDLQNQEKLLREELNIYSSKYDDFQNSLQMSNDIFTSYKSEIEKMCKNTKKLEKESADWKRKYVALSEEVADLTTQKMARDMYIAKMKKQMEQLQKLLRTLQAERTTLHQILKDNNIERPPMPVLPPEPEPPTLPLSRPLLPPTPQKDDKLELMVKNCAEFKQTLAKLQSQVSEISSKATDKPPAEEPKKNKNRKSKGKQKVCPTKDSTKVQTPNSSDQVPKEDNPTEQSEVEASTDANSAVDGRVSPIKEVIGDNPSTTENSSNKPSKQDMCKQESTLNTANESIKLEESISKEHRIKEEYSMENARVEIKTEQPQAPLADMNTVSERPLLVQSQDSPSIIKTAEEPLVMQLQSASTTVKSEILEESLDKQPQDPSTILNENAAPEQSVAPQPENPPITTTPDII